MSAATNLTIPDANTIRAQITATRKELVALRRLLRLANAAEEAERARRARADANSEARDAT